MSSAISQFALLRDSAMRDHTISIFSEALEIFSQIFHLKLNLPYLPEQSTPHTLVMKTHMRILCVFMHLCVHMCVFIVCALFGRTGVASIKLETL